MLGSVLGDNSRLGFTLLAALRSHLLRQPFLTILTMLVVALSVALVVALDLGSRSIEQALTSSAEALRGSADLEITAGAVGMPERLLAEVSASPSVRTAAPVIEAIVRIVGGPGDGGPLRIMGVDLLADQAVRSYTTIQRSLRVLDPLRLIAKSDSMIVSEVLAQRLGLGDGDTLTVRSTTGEHRLVVRGVLAPGGMADAYGGQIVVMDVYALQALLAREGWLDRIDVLLVPHANVKEAKTQIAAKVLGFATVRTPDPADQYVAAAMSTLKFAGGVIAVVGTLVAGFLCYAALAASVDRRTRLFALLRAAGLEARSIHKLVYIDSVSVGVAGVGLGIPLGWWVAKLFVAVSSQTSSWMSGVEIKPAPISAAVLLVGAMVGIGVSLVSAALAARRSTRLPPHEGIAGGRGLGFGSGGVPSAPAWSLSGVLLVMWIVAWKVSVPIPAIYRTAIVFALGIAVLWVALGPLLGALLSSVRIGVERLAPGIGRVAGGSLRMRLNQTRIAVTSIAALVAATSSLWIMIVSMVATFDQHGSTKGGAIVTANNFLDSQLRDPLRDETVDAVAATPGVEAVFRHYFTETIYQGETVRLSAISANVLADRIGFDLTEREADDREIARALEAGSVLVFEAFQRHFGVKVGSLIRLDTPQGPQEFPVVGVRPAYYASSTGGIQMDLSVFDRHWPRPGVANLIIWTSGQEQSVLDALQKGAGALQPLFFVTGAAKERAARAMLESYSRPIRALLGLVVVIAGAAVANLLVGSASESKGDIALLKCLGASRRQILGLVLIEGLFVGVVGVLAGLALGMACAVPIRAVLTEQFGWLISWSIRPAELALLSIGTISASALIGVVTGARIRREVSWNTLAPE